MGVCQETLGEMACTQDVRGLSPPGLFVTAPFIKINGYPLILLDIPDRKFIIFGAIFWAQDTFILALLMLSFVLFIIVFTVTFGRIWCGWACPQTLFLEMVFRKIEFLVEGDYQARRKLDQSPWTTRKIFKKSLKHGLFLLVAFLMTNVFLMWFIGYERLFAIISDPVGKHLTEFLVMMAVSLFFYWMYSYFREQLCTMVCPYGRMQGFCWTGGAWWFPTTTNGENPAAPGPPGIVSTAGSAWPYAPPPSISATAPSSNASTVPPVSTSATG